MPPLQNPRRETFAQLVALGTMPLIEAYREIVAFRPGRPMSANEAEIRTLIAAVEAVKLTIDPAKTRLCVYGDSQIALGWAEKAGQNARYKPPRNCWPGYISAVADLYACLRPFAQVATKWQPRERNVQIFGH